MKRHETPVTAYIKFNKLCLSQVIRHLNSVNQWWLSSFLISGHSAKKASLRSALEAFSVAKQVIWMLTFRAAAVTQVQSTCLPTGACGHLMAAWSCWAGSELLALLVLLKGSTGAPCDPQWGDTGGQVRPLVGELDPTCHNWRSERQTERGKKGRKKQQRCPPNWTRSTDSRLPSLLTETGTETTGRDDPRVLRAQEAIQP